jgi:hypothetical protein
LKKIQTRIAFPLGFGKSILIGIRKKIDTIDFLKKIKNE